MAIVGAGGDIGLGFERKGNYDIVREECGDFRRNGNI